MTAIPTLMSEKDGIGHQNICKLAFRSLSETHPHDLSKISVLWHEGEMHEALDKEGKCDEVEEHLFGMILTGTFKGYVSRELKGMC